MQAPLAWAVGALALAVATTGTAVAATGQLVNVVDASTGTPAKVTRSGALLVSDGLGPVTVDGRVAPAVPAQVSYGGTAADVTGNQSACTTAPLTLPAGVPVLVERVAVTFQGARSTDRPRAHVQLTSRTGSGDTTVELPVPLADDAFNVGAAGVVDVGAVVRAGTSAGAADGQVYRLQVCTNRGTGLAGTTAQVLVLGLR